MRVSFRAVNRLYVRPAVISDEEAEEAAQAEEAKQDDANKSVSEDNEPVSESAESEK